MRHYNSVFHGLIQFIDWAGFDRLCAQHGANHRVRRLDARSHLLALIFGQVSGAQSLREIEAGLKSHEARLYHAGARCVARSTLADANASRSAELFCDLFALMAGQASRATRRQMRGAIRLIDATRIQLSGLSASWAHFTGEHSAAKLHVMFDPVAQVPLHATVTAEKVNDIVQARMTAIEPGATYVFDLAYYDFTWWARLQDAGCRFVTRLKSHTHLHDVDERPVPEGADILSDKTGYLPRRLRRSGPNPMTARVRELEVRISSGKVIRIVSNDLQASAEEIADLYKQRWQIELFFKWIKQNLKIKRFLGTSENAVRIQLFAALITYLLLRRAHQAQRAIASPLTFTRLVRLNLMHRKPITNLADPPERDPPDTAQIAMELTP